MLNTSFSSQKRAIVRVVLGQVQIVGAIVGLCLLLKTGLSRLTVGVIVATGVVSLVSRFLFEHRSVIPTQA